MRALVTGGGGFLGSAIVRQLLERGDEVTILARNRYPVLEEMGASGVQHDLCQSARLEGLVRGMDVVFHVAAITGYWGSRKDFWSINVQGTQNLLQACRRTGVTRFVYTSSPSVTFHGVDEEGRGEDECTYPSKFQAHYPETKAAAEQLVLEANDDKLATTALRPHLIYGPGEPNLIPRLIDRAARGRVAIIGRGDNQVGFTYVDNAAVAHLQAADALFLGSVSSGRAYFITDGEPVLFWDFANGLLTGIGARPVTRRVSYRTAHLVAGLLELIWGVFRLSREPPLSRFVVDQLARSHWWSLEAARRDFGYSPLVDPKTAFEQTVKAFHR